jgi:hypothetical protein
MQEEVEMFKEDVWQGIWSHAKKLFRPMIWIAAAQFVVMMGIIMIVLPWAMGPEIMDLIRQNSGATGMDQFQELQLKMQEILENMDKTQLIRGMGLMYLLIFVVMAFFVHIQLNASQQQLINGKVNTLNAFKVGISSKTLQIIAVFILTMLAGMVVTTIIGQLSGNLGIAFLSLILSLLISVRLLAAAPAIVHGDMKVMDALKFGWGNINFTRAAYAVLVAIIGMIVLFLSFLLATGIFSMMGQVGGILSVVYMVLVNVFLAALITSMLSASFFRYVEVEVEDENQADILEI